ncbi:MAG: hypothetical protein LRY25_01105, partial [Flavobacterium sp.]|nr:hypothetical protein [Flavobacterium sp.]
LFEQYVSLPNPQVLEDLRNGLMEVCPFKNKTDYFKPFCFKMGQYTKKYYICPLFNEFENE